MAMLCFRPPPTPSPPETHGRYHTTRDVLFLPFRTKKVALLSRKVDVSFEKSLLLSTVDSKYSKGGIIKITSWLSESLANWKFSGFWLLISDYQQSTPASFRKAFVLANTLMLFMPLNVLAETCEADNSFLNMPLLFGIALIGAAVGGNLARQRRGELKRLNDQLRQINAALRRQAKIESYAPNLSYAPVGRTPEVEVVVDPRKHQLITNLRTGKNYLRNQDLEKAFSEFKAALELAQDLGDYVEEKKAARGLGASLQRQGKYKDAIKYHSRVLEISQHVGEDSGTTEAYGAIADCYTELGDLERAGKFYDKYIARLESD